MSTKLYIVELEVITKRWRTVAVLAENPEEAEELAIENDNADDDVIQQLDFDNDDQTEVKAFKPPYQPDAKQLLNILYTTDDDHTDPWAVAVAVRETELNLNQGE